MSKRVSQRKKFYVSNAIQGRITRRLVLYWALYHLVLWHLLFLSDGLIPEGQMLAFGELYSNFLADNARLILFAIAVLPIIVWDMIKFTNRVAGPFVRFERALKAMTRGERIEKVRLRKKDQVHEFLAVFNEFIEARNRELDRHAALAGESSPQPNQDSSVQEAAADNDSRVLDAVRDIEKSVATLQSEPEDDRSPATPSDQPQ